MAKLGVIGAGSWRTAIAVLPSKPHTVSFDSAVTDKVCFIGLEEPLDVWVDAIINPTQYLYKAENKIEDFDIKNVIDRLESFYAK